MDETQRLKELHELIEKCYYKSKPNKREEKRMWQLFDAMTPERRNERFFELREKINNDTYTDAEFHEWHMIITTPVQSPGLKTVSGIPKDSGPISIHHKF